MTNNSKNISSVLKRLLLVNELTVSELAKQLNIQQSTLFRITTGQTKKPKREIILKIADFFKLSENEFLGEKEIKWEKFGGLFYPLFNKFKKIPLYTWTLDEKSNMQKVKPESIVTYSKPISSNAFALEIKDSSMEPLFLEKSIIICDPQLKYKNGDFVILKLHKFNKLIFRKLIIDVDDYYIRPLNQMFNPITDRKLDRINDKIIATVIQIQYNLE